MPAGDHHSREDNSVTQEVLPGRAAEPAGLVCARITAFP